MNRLELIWNFLEDLQENNSKEWMDQNRKRYNSVKEYWIEEVNLILERLSAHDPYFENFTPKETIMRINNNRMFHPDKPIYKGHLSSSPSKKTDMIAKIYFAVGPEHTMIGGGLYRPDNKALKSIREAIDYDAQELIDIINDKEFLKLFGGLSPDPTALKSAPRGYSNEHPSIDLLRRKSFTAGIEPTKDMLLSSDFTSMVEHVYTVLRPLNSWIERGLSV